MKKKTHKRMRKIFSLLTIMFFLFSFISPLAPFINIASATITSGSIWTTMGDCGNVSQDVNHFAIGDSVYINGSNFLATTTYGWNITKTPTDSNSPVAIDDHYTDENGDFCFLAHIIQEGESGEYKVNFGGKNDNYNVDETCEDNDDDGYCAEADCDDNNADINPTAIELCDGVDNNCDGRIDEDACASKPQKCTDSNPCHTGEECDDGYCVPVGSSCTDSDDDGVCDDLDNCIDTPNPDQLDSDGNDIGDACDDSPVECTSNSDCNSEEECDNGYCVPAGPSCIDIDNDQNCDDSDKCVDVDNDGYGTGDGCLGTDCNDHNPDSWRTGVFYYDFDGDGYYEDGPNRRDDGMMAICYGKDIPEGYTETSVGEDCDDRNPELTTDCSDGSCVEGPVTLRNPSFEEPVFNNNSGWGLFDTASVYWGIDWVVTSDASPKLELQNYVKNTWVASDGVNYAELDSDGRSDGKASVKISQDVNTYEGASYILSFDFSPRPGINEDNNILNVYINGDLVSTTSADGTGKTATDWNSYQIPFTADSDLTSIAFADGGTPNTLGTFIDNVTLELSDCNISYCGDGVVDEGEECDNDSDLCSDECKIEYCGDGVVDQKWEECDGEDGLNEGQECNEKCQIVDDNTCSDLVLARVNVDEVNNFEDDDSNMTSDIYLGSDWYHVPAGTWFPLHSNGSYFTDSDIASYEDVPGLAVQRLENDVRAVMYGTHPSKDKEHIHGNIEFYNASVLDQRSDKSNDKPKNNRLEKGFDGNGVDSYNAGNDEVWFEDGNNSQSFFWLTTTTADDGYYTGWEIQNKCQESICGHKYNYYTEETIPDWTVYLKEKQKCEKGDEWADEVILYENNDSVSDPDRTHPERALGPAQDNDTYNFVSLGLGGTLILSFDNVIRNENGPDLQVYETTYGSNPGYQEYVHVYASQNGTDWTDLGSQQQSENMLFDLGDLEWATYVKLVDESTVEGGDGFDVDGVRALNCYDWNTTQSSVTDESGSYCFYDLDEGDYRVEEDISDPAWTYDRYYYKDISYPDCTDLNQFTITSYDASQARVVEPQETCTVNFYNHPNNYCGDYNLDENEECDDGNNVNGDGCDESCQLETSTVETCVYIDEDGLASTTDDRSLASSSVWSFLLQNVLASSTIETTDGCFAINVDPGSYHLEGAQATTWTPLAPADDYYNFVASYNDSSDFEFVYHYDDPRVDEWCGDNIINGEEECDDGNNINGDGCNEYCVNEVKKSSGGGGGGLVNYCGDGRIQNPNSYGQKEECDGSAGLKEGETCSNICTIISSEKVMVLGEEGAPSLTISIDPAFATANAGDRNVKFDIIVKNEGEIDSVNTELDVTLPDGFSYHDPSVSGVWALGDIASGEESTTTIFLDIAQTADNQTYSIAATAKSDNNAEISAPANVEIEKVVVLAETGFSVNEFIFLLFALFLSSASVMYLRKQE